MPDELVQFPALDTGMLAQLPMELEIERLVRETKFPDGSQVTSGVDSRLRYRWLIRYANLSDLEWVRFMEFFESSERGAKPFSFPDPMGNLVAQSQNLLDPVWDISPGLVVDRYEDPVFSSAAILTNSTPFALSLAQVAEVAGPFATCFSVYAMWPGVSSFSMMLSSSSESQTKPFTASEWSRYSVRIGLQASSSVRTVSIIVPPYSQLVVANPQLEIAAQPNAYRATGIRADLYSPAWMSQEYLAGQQPAPGAHSLTLQIESIRPL